MANRIVLIAWSAGLAAASSTERMHHHGQPSRRFLGLSEQQADTGHAWADSGAPRPTLAPGHTSTAHPGMCALINGVSFCGCWVLMLGAWWSKEDAAGTCAVATLLVLLASVIASVYSCYHGLIRDYREGDFKNEEWQPCSLTAGLAVVGYAVVLILCCKAPKQVAPVVCEACWTRAARDPAPLPPTSAPPEDDPLEAEQRYLSGDSFRTRCQKVFDRANASKSGHLSLEEFKSVEMFVFDLTEEEYRRGVTLPLVVEAFGRGDKNQDGVLNFDEFLDVMRFIHATARLGRRDAGELVPGMGGTDPPAAQAARSENQI